MSSNITVERICEFCGKKFLAKTTRTRFCGKSCSARNIKRQESLAKIAISNKETHNREIQSSGLEDLHLKDVFTITDAAKYLSVSRRTVYTWLNEGKIKGKRVSNRKVLILKSHLLSFLNSAEGYEKPIPPEDVKRDYYTYKDVVAKYKISQMWLHLIVKRNEIFKLRRSGVVYLRKSQIDTYFVNYENDIKRITEWYTVLEIIERYGITRDAIYGRVKENNIPKKTEGRYVKISKKHFDEIFEVEL